MRCLWLTADSPERVATGAVAYSVGLAASLAGRGWEVRALTLGRGASFEASGVGWHPVGGDRRRRLRSLLGRGPSMANMCATRPFRRELLRQLGDDRFDVVVVSHLQMGWAASLIANARRRDGGPVVVYCSHNHEEVVRREVARRSGASSVAGVALHMDAVRATRLERALLATADLVTCITDEDARSVRPFRAGEVMVLKPGYDGPRLARRVIDSTTPRRVVVLGSLNWHVKQRNLQQFLEVADGAFAAAGIELVVAGEAPRAFLDRMQHRFAATRFTGYVDDVTSILAGARVGIVAEPLGGGFKLKSLDYVFHRVPMAVLAGSVAGLPLEAGKGYLRYENLDALVEGVSASVDDDTLLNSLHEAAFAACSARFDWGDRGRDLDAALRALLAKGSRTA